MSQVQSTLYLSTNAKKVTVSVLYWYEKLSSLRTEIFGMILKRIKKLVSAFIHLRLAVGNACLDLHLRTAPEIHASRDANRGCRSHIASHGWDTARCGKVLVWGGRSIPNGAQTRSQRAHAQTRPENPKTGPKTAMVPQNRPSRPISATLSLCVCV